MSIFNMLNGRGLGNAGGPLRGKVIFSSSGISGDENNGGAGGTYDNVTNSYAFTWTPPIGVTNVSIVAIGGGGGGAGSGGTNGGGGGGGGLAYKNNLTVDPATTYNLQVGAGGPPGLAGTESWFNSSTYFKAGAGVTGTVGTDSPIKGQVLFTTSSTLPNKTTNLTNVSYVWTCPLYVTSINAVTVGAGGGGGASGGGGGGLAYGNNIPVTPGQDYKIQVGIGGKIISRTWPGFLTNDHGGVYGQNFCILDSVDGLYVGQHVTCGYLVWNTVISSINVGLKQVTFSNSFVRTNLVGQRFNFSFNGGASFIQNMSTNETYLIGGGGGTAYGTENYNYVGTYRESAVGNYVNVYGLQTGYGGGGGGAGGYGARGGNGPQVGSYYLFGAGGYSSGTYKTGGGDGGDGGGWQQYVQRTSNPYSSGYLGPYYNYGYAGVNGGGWGAGAGGSNGYWGGNGGGVTPDGSSNVITSSGAAPPTGYATYSWTNTYPGSDGTGTGSYGGGGGGLNKIGQHGVVKIVWGRGRTYPSNAADVTATSYIPGTEYGGGGGGGAAGYSGIGGSGGSDIGYGAPNAGGAGGIGSGTVTPTSYRGGAGGGSVGEVTEFGAAGPTSGGSGAGGSGGYLSQYGGGGTGLLGRSSYNNASALTGGGTATAYGSSAAAVNNGASGGTNGTSTTGGLYGGGGPYNGTGGDGGICILWGIGNNYPNPTNLP